MSLRPIWTCLLRRTQLRHPQLPSHICLANRRWKSTAAAGFRSGPSWTTSRVLLFSAFASSLTYLFGLTGTGLHIEELWIKEKFPVYGSIKDLDKASHFKIYFQQKANTSSYRLSQSFANHFLKTQLVPTMKTFERMASPNGPRSTLSSFLLLLPTQKLLKRSRKLPEYALSIACP